MRQTFLPKTLMTELKMWPLERQQRFRFIKASERVLSLMTHIRRRLRTCQHK